MEPHDDSESFLGRHDLSMLFTRYFILNVHSTVQTSSNRAVVSEYNQLRELSIPKFQTILKISADFCLCFILSSRLLEHSPQLFYSLTKTQNNKRNKGKFQTKRKNTKQKRF